MIQQKGSSSVFGAVDDAFHFSWRGRHFCFSAQKHGGGIASIMDMVFFFLVGKGERVSRSLNGRWILRD